MSKHVDKQKKGMCGITIDIARNLIINRHH